MTTPQPTTDTDIPSQLGNYDILSKIAEGGMGTVYKAQHRFTRDVVAIKVIAPGPSRNPVLLQRFEREFLAAKVLDHPNVVRAIEYCPAGPHPFLVMEYVDGESIGQRIERIGAIPEAEAVRLIAQVCDGLQRAHKQGLVHRDVKPDNILITRTGVAKLTDMGLVKEVDNDMNLTKTGRGLGTPHYMAPEQFRNAKGVDTRGDIYSLGATLYAMVTGQIPFANNNPLDCWMKKIKNQFPPPKELLPGLTVRIDWAIRRAMSAEPAQRPSSCREFLEDLTGQTRGDSGTVDQKEAGGDQWYVVYRDEDGQQRTVKGSTDAIRRAIRDGQVGEPSTVLVGRSKTGQFQPLPSTPAFRDLLVNPAPLPTRRSAAELSPSPNSITPPGPRTSRASSDNSCVDFSTPPDPESPSGGYNRHTSLSGRHAGPPSGRQVPSSPTTRPVPTPRQVGIPTPRPSADPESDTLPSTTMRRARRLAIPTTSDAPTGLKKVVDWTPYLAALVLLLSAILVYLLLTR